jgi:hypothetical protein
MISQYIRLHGTQIIWLYFGFCVKTWCIYMLTVNIALAGHGLSAKRASKVVSVFALLNGFPHIGLP